VSPVLSRSAPSLGSLAATPRIEKTLSHPCRSEGRGQETCLGPRGRQRGGSTGFIRAVYLPQHDYAGVGVEPVPSLPWRALLDAVTFRGGSFLQRMRGATPFRYRERTCAGARAHVRWGSMVNALGFQRTCYRVTGHLRARHVLGKTPFLDEVTRATPGYESTWKFLPDQQKPSNKCFRRNAL